MDFQEYEDRSSLGHKKFVAMKIDTVLKFWSNLCFKTAQPLGFEPGAELTSTWQNRCNLRRKSIEPRETCCQSKAPTETRSDAVFRFCSCSWQNMDRHWDTTITWSQVLTSVKSHDPIATTWSNSPSGNWWSSSVWRRLTRMVKEKVRWCFAMVSHSTIGYLCWQKDEEPRKGFNIAWIQTLPATSCTSEQLKDIHEKMLLILSSKTMYCYQKDLLSTSTTSGMQAKRIAW